MSRKNAAAASTALSLAEYIDNYPGMPEGARAAMLLLKLDIVSCLHYAWREAHNKMLPPSPCSLSQQRPLHLIPHVLMSDEVGVSMKRRVLRNLAGEARDRAGPRLPPRVPDLASLKMARKL